MYGPQWRHPASALLRQCRSAARASRMAAMRSRLQCDSIARASLAARAACFDGDGPRNACRRAMARLDRLRPPWETHRASITTDRHRNLRDEASLAMSAIPTGTGTGAEDDKMDCADNRGRGVALCRGVWGTGRTRSELPSPASSRTVTKRPHDAGKGMANTLRRFSKGTYFSPGCAPDFDVFRSVGFWLSSSQTARPYPGCIWGNKPTPRRS